MPVGYVEVKDVITIEFNSLACGFCSATLPVSKPSSYCRYPGLPHLFDSFEQVSTARTRRRPLRSQCRGCEVAFFGPYLLANNLKATINLSGGDLRPWRVALLGELFRCRLAIGAPRTLSTSRHESEHQERSDYRYCD
jgi:hypothetical protein